MTCVRVAQLEPAGKRARGDQWPLRECVISPFCANDSDVYSELRYSPAPSAFSRQHWIIKTASRIAETGPDETELEVACLPFFKADRQSAW